jgi:hypothetical protein
MMEPLAQIWDDPEYQELGIFGKFLAAVISVAVWPLVFFVGGDND